MTSSTRQRLRETAERAKVDPDLMTAIDPDEFLDLLSSLDRMEAVVRAAVEWHETGAENCDAGGYPGVTREHCPRCKLLDAIVNCDAYLASAGSEEG